MSISRRSSAERCAALWRALRALLALELRTRRRNGWTSLWTLLALALPVAGIAAGGALLRTSQATAAERLAPRFGSAQLRIDGVTRAQAAALLEPQAQALEGCWLWSQNLRYEQPGRTLDVHAMALEPGAAGLGLLRLSGADWPQIAEERLLSPTLQRALGLEPGAGLAALGPISPGRLLPGTAQLPEDLAAPLLLCAPEALPANTRGAFLVRQRDATPAPNGSRGLPPLARLALSAERRGHTVSLPPREPHGDAFEALAIFLLGGFAVSQAALLIAAALTVGLARRRREIGLLQAQGATRGQLLGATLLARGVEALAAGVLGSLLGALLAALLAPGLDSWNGRWNGPLELSWPHLLLAPVLALAMALLAVGWPARRALAVPILEALGAFRPAHRAPRLALALVLLVLAAALFGWGRWQSTAPNPALLLCSAVLGLLGLCSLAPRLLSASGRIAGGLPLSWRVAVRDGRRFPHRDGAVVVATLCASALCVTLLILIQSVDRALLRQPAELQSHAVRLLPRALILWAWAAGALISTVAGALALSETRRDQACLQALGAPPHLLRRMQASRLAYLAALGAALALPAGAWPLFGLLPLANVPIEWRTPWPNLLALLLGLPLWAYLGAIAFWRAPRQLATEKP